MSIYADWKKTIEDHSKNQKDQQTFWDGFCEREKHIYEDILGRQDPHVEGTVADLALRYDMPETEILGYLDGALESIKGKLPDLDTIESDTMIAMDYDFEKLYYNMVKVPAPWLYGLSEWNDILDKDTQKKIYKKCRNRNTIVKGKKIGRNDPCPCGSGKKYKNCCGRNA